MKGSWKRNDILTSMIFLKYYLQPGKPNSPKSRNIYLLYPFQGNHKIIHCVHLPHKQNANTKAHSV